MAGWILPTLGYVVLVGLFGIVQKLALRDMSWQELFLWLPFAYIILAAVLAATGTRFSTGPGWGWAALSSVIGAAGLLLFAIALSHGEVSVVVPVSSVYVLVTAVASIAFLSERFTIERGIGTALVVAGVVLLSR